MDKIIYWKMLANEHKVKCKEYKNKYVWVLEYPYSESIEEIILIQDFKKNTPDHKDQIDNVLSIAHVFLGESVVLSYDSVGGKTTTMVGKRVDVPVMLRIILREFFDSLSSEREMELAQEAINGAQVSNLSHFFSDLNNNSLNIRCELNKLVILTNDENEIIPKGHLLYKSSTVALKDIL